MASISFLQARNGDCIHIENDGHHIIIDSGETCNELISIVEEINRSNKQIDLLVITHYDADHIKAICQILKEFSVEERNKIIKKVWFNATKIGYIGNNLLSARDATQFAKLLIDSRIEWVSCMERGMSFSIGNMKLEVLDGGRVYTRAIDRAKLLNYKCDWRTDLQTLEKYIDDDELDSSETNSQSMILILIIGEKHVLLPGDAVPKQLKLALEYYAAGKKTSFDLVKLPHHGSYKNMTQDILSLIRCSEYLISTDGSKYYHPNKKLMMKIIKWGERKGKQKLVFHMNYYEELFSKLNITQQEMDHYSFMCDGKRTFKF